MCVCWALHPPPEAANDIVVGHSYASVGVAAAAAAAAAAAVAVVVEVAAVVAATSAAAASALSVRALFASN